MRPDLSHRFMSRAFILSCLVCGMMTINMRKANGQNQEAEKQPQEAVTVQPQSEPLVAEARPAPEPRRVRQPVQEYTTVMDPVDGNVQHLEQEMNPFVSYTHLGTDFGFIGRAVGGIGWQVGTVRVDMPDGSWGGMWHALAGLGDDRTQTLDFTAAFPPFITSRYQSKIVGLEFRAKGKGTFKLEIKDVNQNMLWEKMVSLDSPDMRTFVENLEPEQIGKAKYLNWVAQPGTQAELDSLSFIMLAPAVAFDEYVFLSSYAKLARSYSQNTGYVKDRAHIREGIFDNVPASGLFALATALASKLGMVEEAYASQVLNRIHENTAAMTEANGWLPHFVRLNAEGRYDIVPHTEFSTVDSSIYYHSMLLAAQIMQDEGILSQVERMIQNITLENLVDRNGYIGHGFKHDGVKDPLPSVWKDWGGETALVLALVNMMQDSVPPIMEKTGHVHDGVGFIVEIQSLFYPDFDSTKPDQVSGQNWMAARQDMLKRQREYFTINWPESRAAKLGFYGLSAGEARLGIGYMVSGVELPKQSFLHPHYVLLSACTDPDSSNVYDILRRMESEQLFPPWGLVENFNRDIQEILPMQSALNAGFESIGAYHLLTRHRGQSNVLHDACLNNNQLRKAAEMFYPLVPTSYKPAKKQEQAE